MVDLFIAKKTKSNRQEKVAKEIFVLISDIFIKHDLPITTDKDNNCIKPNSSLTVTKVDISPDLRNAKVFVTTLGGIDSHFVEKYLNCNMWFIKKQLAHNLRLKFMPEIIFKNDLSFDLAQKLDEIIDQNI